MDWVLGHSAYVSGDTPEQNDVKERVIDGDRSRPVKNRTLAGNVCAATVHMSRHRVLVIDDDRDTRTILEMTLSFAGYEVSLAGDGYQGLQLARRDRPDVILLDLAMPVLDGFEFREQQL